LITFLIVSSLQFVLSVWFLYTCFGMYSSSPFFWRNRSNTITKAIITAKKTNTMTTVVSIIKSIDTSAPYPFGTRAVKLSLPQPDKNSAIELNINRALNFPIHPFIRLYLSFSVCFYYYNSVFLLYFGEIKIVKVNIIE